MWEFKRQNTFGATSFSSYGGFWLAYSIYGILLSAGIFQPTHDGEKMMLSLWGILTFILMAPTLELNFALYRTAQKYTIERPELQEVRGTVIGAPPLVSKNCTDSGISADPRSLLSL